MKSTRWQKQHIHFRSIVWGASAAVSVLLMIILLLLGVGADIIGISFISVFLFMRVLLAFALKNRFANSMVRILKFDYEEVERDFRILFKNKNIRFHRKEKEDAFYYEFLGRKLSMTAEPFWVSADINQKPVTKLTLYELTGENSAFAEMLADTIDEMAEQLTIGQKKSDTQKTNAPLA